MPVSKNIGGSNIAFKSFSLADAGSAGTNWLGGFYEAPVTDVTLTIGGTVTQTLGTAAEVKAAHAFIVMSGAGGANLTITVTGVSINDSGTRNGSDSEVLTTDTSALATNEYIETSKKWLGQVTYTLTGSAGAATFNYGFSKYEDFGNRNFTVTDIEFVGKGGASETGLDVVLLLHSTAGWTYHASAFVAGGTVISDLATDHSTDNNLTNGDFFAYKRAGLSTSVIGNNGQGVIIKIVTAVNNSIDFATCHVGVLI